LKPEQWKHQQNAKDPHAVGNTEVASPTFTGAETAWNNRGKFRGLQHEFCAHAVSVITCKSCPTAQPAEMTVPDAEFTFRTALLRATP